MSLYNLLGDRIAIFIEYLYGYFRRWQDSTECFFRQMHTCDS